MSLMEFNPIAFGIVRDIVALLIIVGIFIWICKKFED
jgi:hypothetical protein